MRILALRLAVKPPLRRLSEITCLPTSARNRRPYRSRGFSAACPRRVLVLSACATKMRGSLVPAGWRRANAMPNFHRRLSLPAIGYCSSSATSVDEKSALGALKTVTVLGTSSTAAKMKA